MGFLSSLFNPTKGTKKGYKRARRDFRQTREKVDPFYEGYVQDGTWSRDRLATLLGRDGVDAQRTAQEQFLTSPGFEFQMERGVDAIDASAAARGSLNSGKTLKAQQEFGQGLYAQDFNNYRNMLAGMGQMGFQGATGLMNNSNQYGNLEIGYGQAKDAGNQAALGNLIGLGTTVASFGAGMPALGGRGSGVLANFFRPQGQTPQMPIYQNGRVNPYQPY